jgi:DNA-binding HxlR family transcriptional regulator
VTSQRSGCLVNAAIEVLGDRWSLIVLRDIMFGDRRHFRTLQRESEESIASNILASRLRDLVAADLLTREDVGSGRRAAYSLTESAIQLVPVLAELGWRGLQHRPTTEPPRARARIPERAVQMRVKRGRRLHFQLPRSRLKAPQPGKHRGFCGAAQENRTLDLLITSEMLYRLS